mmetsp:Transcript_23631/g.42276  ORF Transcript_23631/g.42276 Transcript_23631/m.42276 type:complete len:129 (-) Transcript_23631:379-765(-)
MHISSLSFCCGDFLLAHLILHLSSFCISLAVVSGEPHDGQLADCYALGATIFCIKFGGRPPFIGKGGQKNQKLLDLYNQIKDAPLLFPDPVDSGLRDLISRLMLKDPIRRMRLLDALKHPWLVEENKN